VVAAKLLESRSQRCQPFLVEVVKWCGHTHRVVAPPSCAPIAAIAAIRAPAVRRPCALRMLDETWSLHHATIDGADWPIAGRLLADLLADLLESI